MVLSFLITSHNESFLFIPKYCGIYNKRVYVLNFGSKNRSQRFAPPELSAPYCGKRSCYFLKYKS